jgi:hypothetical protein
MSTTLIFRRPGTGSLRLTSALVPRWTLAEAGDTADTPTVDGGVVYVTDIGGMLWAIVLTMCTAAVLCGNTTLEDITAWTRRGADERVLAGLPPRCRGSVRAPGTRTQSSGAGGSRAQALADHAGTFLARCAMPGPVTFSVTVPCWLPGIAVDGKAVCDAAGPDGMVPYLLSAAAAQRAYIRSVAHTACPGHAPATSIRHYPISTSSSWLVVAICRHR